MRDKNVCIEVLVDNRPVTEYFHEGATFIEGREGKDFTIKISNNRNNRVLAIPSVDGLSVLDGKPASHDSMGYIVPAHTSITIPGWTLDQTAAAKFFFTQKEDSYTTRTAAGTQTGVIGVIFYDEKGCEGLEPYDVLRHYSGIMYNGDPLSNSLSNSFGSGVTGSMGPSGPKGHSGPVGTRACINQMSVEKSAEAFGLGTGFGKKTDFATNKSTFDRGNFVTGLTLYYDNKRNLEKRGIKFPVTSTRYTSLPQAFPGIGCTPPPGWAG